MNNLSDTVAQQLNQVLNINVLCVGDVMLDRYIDGTVERISPEAPVPILHIQRQFDHPGGVANVAHNIASLGGNVNLCGIIGPDSNGTILSNILDSVDGINANLLIAPTACTTLKTRFVCQHQQLLRADSEDILPPDTEHQALLHSMIFEKLTLAKAVVLSDYKKGALNEDLIQEIIKYGRKHHIPTIIDPKGDDFANYRGATVITPNRFELARATQMPCHNDDDAEILRAAQKLIDQFNFSNILVTRSEKGMTLLKHDGTFQHFAAQAEDVFDVSGAGDTVVACLSLALGASLSLEDAAVLANIAGGIVVAKSGTATVSSHEIQAKLNQPNAYVPSDESRLIGQKIMDRAQIVAQTQKWHQQGLRVGFTNGCFDLLHPGHLSLLQQATQACDKLIVAINADSSIKQLKGAERPVINEGQRAQLLAMLPHIDAVTIFTENTPLEIIQALKPDVLVKGADYALDEIVGKSDVEELGGKIIRINYVDGFSSSRIIDKIKGASN